ncbi:CU044_5270 family protein [Pseudonocardia alaniniphila]|uniref:CU044_5270 family protein n=1 Tax=Pseudonocardia alaniniphila TaxID=75291 RepID=A0ABS9TPR1_9PSEU|nr:CU044_5270 family protein [Pseudonocardia alaniniphila]MCH6170368.1 CU044_5270 family protein [Pseudonocardia alaniniphila]
MNEIELLAGMRAETPEDPEALARARQRLLQRAADPAVRRARPQQAQRRWVWPLAGVGGLAAAGLVVTVVLGGITPAAPVVNAPVGAVQPGGQNILLVAAERAEDAAPGSGRYWVNRTESGVISEVGPADNRYRVVERGRAETWVAQAPDGTSWWISQSLGARPLGPADRAAWQRDGEPDSWTVDAPAGKRGSLEISAAERPPFGNPIGTGSESFALGDRNVTQQEIDALPTDPAQLRSALLDRFHGGGGDMPTDQDRWLFAVGSNIITDMPVSPGVRAAAYRMLDDLSGVRDLGSVQDAQGRTGQAVAVIDESRNGTFESRLIIDPDSGRPLARETRLVQPDGSAELTNYELVVGTGYTDDSPPPVPAPR